MADGVSLHLEDTEKKCEELKIRNEPLPIECLEKGNIVPRMAVNLVMKPNKPPTNSITPKTTPKSATKSKKTTSAKKTTPTKNITTTTKNTTTTTKKTTTSAKKTTTTAKKTTTTKKKPPTHATTPKPRPPPAPSVTTPSTKKTVTTTAKTNTTKLATSSLSLSAHFESTTSEPDDDLANQLDTKAKGNNASDSAGSLSPAIIAVIVLAVVIIIGIGVTVAVLMFRRKKNVAKSQKPQVAPKLEMAEAPPKSPEKKTPVSVSKEKINGKEFVYNGPLQMSAGVKGNLKHETSGQKSVEFDKVEFDNDLNEVVDIGTDIETVAQSTIAEESTLGTVGGNAPSLTVSKEGSKMEKEAGKMGGKSKEKTKSD